MSPLTFDLDQLLAAWKTRLQEWSADGSLVAAAREALLLSEVPQELERLAGQWALGDFSGLPPIQVLEGTVLPGAAGAYAISTGTIYLNGDWLASASEDRVFAVLTEELGHHLDGLLNDTDTQADEGKEFAQLLNLAVVANNDIALRGDYGIAYVDSVEVGLEYSHSQSHTSSVGGGGGSWLSPPIRKFEVSLPDRLEAFSVVLEFDQFAENVPWSIPQVYSDVLAFVNDAASLIEIYNTLDPLRDSTSSTIETNWWVESQNYIEFLERFNEYLLAKSFTLLAPKILTPGGFLAGFAFQYIVDTFVASILDN